jgi:hypothetical protein
VEGSGAEGESGWDAEVEAGGGNGALDSGDLRWLDGRTFVALHWRDVLQTVLFGARRFNSLSALIRNDAVWREGEGPRMRRMSGAEMPPREGTNGITAKDTEDTEKKNISGRSPLGEEVI